MPKKIENFTILPHSLSCQMALVHLRDTTDKHGLQFQITIHGQNKMYTFQASTKEVSDMWTAEIKRLLLAQFSLMKGEERVVGHFCFYVNVSSWLCAFSGHACLPKPLFRLA